MVGAAATWFISMFRAPILGDIGEGFAWLVGWMMLAVVFVIGLISTVIGVIVKVLT